MNWASSAYHVTPLVKPALAVVALFTFLGTWNDYLGPLIYVNQSQLYTLSMGLASLSSNITQQASNIWRTLLDVGQRNHHRPDNLFIFFLSEPSSRISLTVSRIDIRSNFDYREKMIARGSSSMDFSPDQRRLHHQSPDLVPLRRT
jgi:hypothetical protein